VPVNLIEGIEEKAMAGSLTVRLDTAVLQALDRLADKTLRSRDWHVSQAIQDYVALNSWQLERIEEGIMAADQGDFASDDEVARVEAKFRR
jgi:predicted transcriptional regulator